MNTSWGKPQTIATKGGVAPVTVIRKSANGYTWRLMVQFEQLAIGTARTQLACREAVRKLKSQMAGEPEPPPYRRKKL